MTTVIYNGVILRDCETKMFDQTVEYDESGTDYLLSRFKIRVASTLVATQYPERQFGIETPTGANATQRAREVQKRLAEPRRDFWMLIDHGVHNERLLASEIAALDEPFKSGIDDYLLIAAGVPEGLMELHPLSTQYGSEDTIARVDVVDVNNGPKPQRVNVTEIIGGRSLRVEFEIEVCRKLCLGDADSPPSVALFGTVPSTDGQVMSNRWHLDESKDENWITTRVLQGTLRVTQKAFWPHLLRAACVPPLLKGYKRTHQSFVDDPTGLVLKYRIEDRQAHAAPPWPAIAWQGHHAEAASGPNGSILTGEISIRLTGPPGCDKVQLIGAAGKIAVDRIKGLVPVFEGGERTAYNTIIKSAAVVNILNEPVIELRVSAQYTQEQMTRRALAIRIQEMGKPLTTLTGTDPYEVEGYDPRVWPVPLAYDSEEPAGLFACYLQHPCSVWHSVPGSIPLEIVTTPSRPEVEESGYPDAYQYTSSHDLPDDETYLRSHTSSPSDRPLDIYNFPYFFIDLENEYRWVTGWAQLPYADTNPAAAKSALLVRLHGRIAKRILTLTATRDGQPPILPSFAEELTDPNGIREVLEESIVTAKAPEVMADGSGQRYSLRVQNVYLMERAPTATEKLRTGSTPLDKSSPANHLIDLNTHAAHGGTMQ